MAERRTPGWTEGLVVGLMLGWPLLLSPLGPVFMLLVPYIAAGLGWSLIIAGFWVFFRQGQTAHLVAPAAVCAVSFLFPMFWEFWPFWRWIVAGSGCLFIVAGVWVLFPAPAAGLMVATLVCHA